MKNGIVEAWRRTRTGGPALVRGSWLLALLPFSACGGRTALEIDRSLPAVSDQAAAGSAPCAADWDQITWDDTLDEAVVYLWTTSESDTWAVVSGDVASSAGAGFFYRDHWDGSRWTRTTSDHDPSGHFGEQQIWTSKSGQVFAGSSQNLQRWSGSAWTDWANTPGCGAIGGSAADDLWCATENEIWRFDGITWTHQAMSGIRGILARARDDVWVWGTQGASHFDGAQWSLVLTDLVKRVAESEPTDVWAVQDGNLFHTTAPGSAWSRQNPTGGRISGLWSQSTTNTWIVAAGAAMRWNGLSWQLMPLPMQDERLLISGSSEDIWIAGTQLLAHGHPLCP